MNLRPKIPHLKIITALTITTLIALQGLYISPNNYSLFFGNIKLATSGEGFWDVDQVQLTIIDNTNGRQYRTTIATVTGYNTVEWQTDSTPCISASGHNICGREDVVACSRVIPFGTVIEIYGKRYYCLDRLASKYDNRFDISFDKNVGDARLFGKRITEVKIYDTKK